MYSPLSTEIYHTNAPNVSIQCSSNFSVQGKYLSLNSTYTMKQLWYIPTYTVNRQRDLRRIPRSIDLHSIVLLWSVHVCDQ